MTLPEILGPDITDRLRSFFGEAAFLVLEASLTRKTGKPYLLCRVRNKEVMAKREEIVRQLWLYRLEHGYKYSHSRLAVEYPVTFGRDTSKRADIVVFDADRPTVPYLVVEVKQGSVKSGKDQLKSYNHATGAPLALWSDGLQAVVWHRKNPNYFVEIPDLPTSGQTIDDIVNTPWTIDTLIDKEKQREKEGLKARSLRQLIEDMENEVLANAGVDVFEEVFKLIFTKLYDELACYRGRYQHLRFRNTNTAAQLKKKLQDLFDEANAEWEGVFAPGEKIKLTADHLMVCVGSLEEWKLFNSNLDVVDEAFEFLVNKSSKGEKGQYFTPRWVIDMCVKMLNPQADETLIDTAAGSAGFTVHAIFHVWLGILRGLGLSQSHLFSMEDKPSACKAYVRDKVFAIDFDEKSVRVARCLNLIAGDGQTNVLHLNTLDWKKWPETVRQEDWTDTYNDGWKKLKKLRAKRDDDRAFTFDVLMANPPFAGDVKQTELLAPYDLAHKKTGKLESAVGRDLLFIERNLDFLRPGGRMAVVLPQGRFNNSSDQRVREFIAERCRILAVVGLHPNTFKPHTGTKTSVLFVQKWNDDPTAGPLCKKVADYPIFFATQRLAPKDTSGDKIYARAADGSTLRDGHGHWVVQHDLFNHEGLTEDGIAEAFAEFAKKERLSFFLGRPFDRARYEALLEGLDAKEVPISEVRIDNEKFRVDDGYFAKLPVLTQRRIEALPHVRLGEICAVFRKGIFDIKAESYTDAGVPFVRIGNLRDGLIESSDIAYISNEAHAAENKTALRFGDLVLSKTAYPAASFVNLEHCNASQDTVAVRLSTEGAQRFSSGFLAAYLNSRYGLALMGRLFQGNVQAHLSLPDGKKIPVPRFSRAFQKGVADALLQADELFKTAGRKLEQATEVFDRGLGLADWQPPEPLTYTRSAAEALDRGRIDAQHYQPKFRALVEKMREGGTVVRLGDELHFCERGRQPNYAAEGLAVINSRHVRTNAVVLDSDNRFAVEEPTARILPLEKRLTIRHGDVLLNGTGVGTLGRCAAYLNNEAALPDNHITILRPSAALDPVFLAAQLNSIVGQMQVEQFFKGSSGQIELYPDDIKEFQIWLAPESVQRTIRNHIESAHAARREASALLDRAKRAVEIAIEEDETAARAFLGADA